MGTGVSLQLVSEGYDFRSVMLQSPFSTYSEAVGEIVATALSRWIVIGLSGGDTFDNVDNIDGEWLSLVYSLLRGRVSTTLSNNTFTCRSYSAPVRVCDSQR